MVRRHRAGVAEGALFGWLTLSSIGLVSAPFASGPVAAQVALGVSSLAVVLLVLWIRSRHYAAVDPADHRVTVRCGRTQHLFDARSLVVVFPAGPSWQAPSIEFVGSDGVVQCGLIGEGKFVRSQRIARLRTELEASGVATRTVR